MPIIDLEKLEAARTAARALFTKNLLETMTLWQQIAMRTDGSGVDSVVYNWLENLAKWRKWIGDRQMKSLKAYKYQIFNEKWESTIAVARDDIERDRLNLIKPRIADMAQGAQRSRDILIFAALTAGFAALCFDEKAFFAADHPVGSGTYSNIIGSGSADPWFLADLSREIKPLILQVETEAELDALDSPTSDHVFLHDEILYGGRAKHNAGYGLPILCFGSQDTLDQENYEDGFAAMMSQRDFDDQPLGVKPTHLIYGASNKAAAEALIKTQIIDGTTNVHYQEVQLILSPYLA